MAWDEYYAVRHSDLYEYRGIAKSLLSLIGLLIIGPPEDEQHPDPNQGFCVASQEYLACELGCSESEIKHLIKTFTKDGWLCVHPYRDKDGHRHNKYSIPAEAIQRIKDRERKRDDNNRWIRASKNTNMRRANNGKRFVAKPQGNLRPGDDEEETFESDSWAQSATTPRGNLPSGLGADCAVASGQIAPKEGSFRESYQTDLERVQSTKEEYERGIESETKRDGHTHVSNRGNLSGDNPRTPNRATASLQPAVIQLRRHNHHFNPGEPTCKEPGCGFICEHPEQNQKRSGSVWKVTCRDCRVLIEEDPVYEGETA